ncbi:MAG: hypothetical protein US57_C0010G0016 [Candidatus Moranbacteria bacterium GW2011_GWC2_37_73]|nr:MAG: hypothetical protein UR95_C0008G0028 [Parcubacteria group bacterium GW2011_GWC1_36_108]KKQ00771.1 MAG: hypothetical protein US09_C0006G0016 [Candidatus Moranbacteria bacterium GW2011_GWD1_36_198]KKQ02232.1 MAG: hypothetical protein US10_C0005G0012 [Candidatus Moranbacteria bacterium GW2011_GWD2_36_198]KKQ39697.1 MAG: hypothetical protein US57_C0010G0016 [Candidatus Moranbacteria bacterium GW2011_GWC2_37_73]
MFIYLDFHIFIIAQKLFILNPSINFLLIILSFDKERCLVFKTERSERIVTKAPLKPLRPIGHLPSSEERKIVKKTFYCICPAILYIGIKIAKTKIPTPKPRKEIRIGSSIVERFLVMRSVSWL